MNSIKGKISGNGTNAGRQKGVILPLFAIGLALIIGMAGLAIDSSHSFDNVTRLQNSLDAAALSAARTLNSSSGDKALAQAHGTATFEQHLYTEASDRGNLEMADNLNITFAFSEKLIPFSETANPSRYVRATVTNHSIRVWFARVLPGVGETTTIGTTAVSGPIPIGGGSGKVCDIAPLVVCGSAPVPGADPVPNEIFGLSYGNGEKYCLKASSNDNNVEKNLPDECEEPADSIGPGNFQLLDMGCEDGPGGAACVRQKLAGEFSSCKAEGNTVETKPGNSVGPTSQGFNTRFGEYKGGQVNATDHPPDFYTSRLTYAEYSNKYKTGAPVDQTNGLANRRVLTVPIGDCSPPMSGQSTIEILGFGCFFMIDKIDKGGKASWIIGELIKQCEAGGDIEYTPDVTDPSSVNYRIILYNDPGNPAS